jgi:protein-tyrosine-phosphatase
MPRRIVFVCTGNTCRSPLAEVLARARYAELPLIFASAGTDAAAGQPASAEACAIARERGLDLEGHRSAPVDARAVADAAWVIGMTRMHAAVLRARLSSRWPGRVGLLGAPGLDWRTAGVPSPANGRTGRDIADQDIADQDIADPWHQDLATYRRTGEQIDDGLVAWAEVFRELCR